MLVSCSRTSARKLRVFELSVALLGRAPHVAHLSALPERANPQSGAAGKPSSVQVGSCPCQWTRVRVPDSFASSTRNRSPAARRMPGRPSGPVSPKTLGLVGRSPPACAFPRQDAWERAEPRARHRGRSAVRWRKRSPQKSAAREGLAHDIALSLSARGRLENSSHASPMLKPRAATTSITNAR